MPGVRWWTADLHLGHANICAYTGRPYPSPDETNIDLIERWNSRVGDADEVYVLGNLAMGQISETLSHCRAPQRVESPRPRRPRPLLGRATAQEEGVGRPVAGGVRGGRLLDPVPLR